MSQHVPTAAPKLLDPRPRVAIVTTEWNAVITDQVLSFARQRWSELGYEADDLRHFTVPGAVELTFAASQLIETEEFEAIIVVGCVVRGDTPHFDYVCRSVTQGITQLNADVTVPVVFGVLTVNNDAQAQERVGKGAEFVDTALKMIAFRREVEEL